MNLFDELRRRYVFRVAVAYLIVGWLVIEVIDTIAPRLGLPEWVPTFFIVLVLAGFPLAVILSWAFERTPEPASQSSNRFPGDRAVARRTSGVEVSRAVTLLNVAQDLADQRRVISAGESRSHARTEGP